MHVKNGSKDLKRYPQISRRVADVVDRRHRLRAVLAGAPGGQELLIPQVQADDAAQDSGDGRERTHCPVLALLPPLLPPLSAVLQIDLIP